MKSTDVRNWKHVLSYTEMAALDNFVELLTHAITKDECLICSGGRVEQVGLCENCRHRLTGKDHDTLAEVTRDYEVTVTVKKR